MKCQCKTKPVWRFTNQRQLCASCFVKYFEKKLKSIIRKYKMPISKIKNNNLKIKIINRIIENLPERRGRLSWESLDDISNNVVYEMMYGRGNIKRLMPKNQPLYFLSDKEILLYAKLAGIKGKIEERRGRVREIDNFIMEIEKKNPDIRHNVVKALII